jgi:hypothetical protein
MLLERPDRIQEVEGLAETGLSKTDQPDLKALGWFVLADFYARQGRRNEHLDAVRKGQHYRAQMRS